MAKIISGKELAARIRSEVKSEIDSLTSEIGRSAKLSVILVGNDPASEIYVRNKQRAAKQCGIESETISLSDDVSLEELTSTIQTLNEDSTVDGILMQLPLPDHLREHENDLISMISPEKDVDGFHPVNIGKLTLGLDTMVSCTPAGVMELIEESGEDISGKLAVILGRSNTVGKPLIQLLLAKNATVITTHSKTKNLSELTKQADIIIAAIGQANFLTSDMVKDGVIIIDVGINRYIEGKITGDVDFEGVKDKASYITTVPGGVGPMTVAMLMKNTLISYKRRNNVEKD